jgi:hypothetical protein
MESFRLFRRGRIAIDAEGLECRLHAGRPLRLTGACGSRVRCIAGCAWVTAPRMDDLFLHQGEHWVADTDGLVLVEAVGAAVVSIHDMQDA